MIENKKWFEEPECEVVKLAVVDVITDSTTDEEMDWGIGEF